MSRYIREEVLNQPDDFVNFMMNDFLTKHGFKLVEFKKQRVYRAGGGWFEMPKFLVWGYQNGVFHIEAWARTLILPGVYGKEKDLDGVYGAVPKRAYKSDIDQLMLLLQQPVPGSRNGMDPGMNGGGNGNMGGQPVNPGYGNGPIIVQGVDTANYATQAMAFGIISLGASAIGIIAMLAGIGIDALFYGGLLFGILGIIYARKGSSSSKRGKATAGLVCGILGTVISGIIVVLGIIGIVLMIAMN